VDSQTQLGLAMDIFPTVGQSYALTSLVRSVKDHIDDERPVTASQVRVLGPTIVSQNVTMTLNGSSLNMTAIAADITAYLNTLVPQQVLYRAKLIQIALDGGAVNAVVTTPSADVTPTGYQMIRPGTINVS
jgi:hypothetical protein